MAGRVLLKILYLLTCRVLGVAVLVFRGDRVYRSEARLSAVTWVFLRDRGVAGTISGCCCRSSTGC